MIPLHVRWSMDFSDVTIIFLAGAITALVLHWLIRKTRR